MNSSVQVLKSVLRRSQVLPEGVARISSLRLLPNGDLLVGGWQNSSNDDSVLVVDRETFTTKASLQRGSTELFFEWRGGIAALGEDCVRLLGEHGAPGRTWRVVNPERITTDPAVVHRPHPPRPLRALAVTNNLICVLLCDTFHVTVGRYVALLRASADDALQWVSGLMALDAPELLKVWRPTLGSSGLLITNWGLQGRRLSLLSSGGEAITLRSGPRFECTLLAHYHVDDAGFLLEGISTPKTGATGFSRCGRYLAIRPHRKNQVFLHRVGDSETFACLSLTAKQNLGAIKASEAAVCFDSTSMLVWTPDGINICDIQDGGLIAERAGVLVEELPQLGARAAQLTAIASSCRDKRKTPAYWDIAAAQMDEAIEYFNASIIAKRRDDDPRAGRSAQARFDALFEKSLLAYSRGAPIGEVAAAAKSLLCDEYPAYMAEHPPGSRFAVQRPSYSAINRYFALVVLSRPTHDEARRFVEAYDRWDYRGPPVRGERDRICEAFVGYLGFAVDRPAATGVNWPKAFEQLWLALDPATEASARAGHLSAFLKGWYRKMSANLVAQTGTHRLASPRYVGYWCLEAAAVAVVQEVDDAELRKSEYYPADFVDWARG